MVETNKLKIAVLSGKGGAGKTFVSINLAAVASAANYIDCDVEEPNGRLFLKPINVVTEPVNVRIPSVDHEKCTGCRLCVEFCQFNALAYIVDQLLIFEEMCHSCGGCMLVCPEGALTEKEKPIGQIERGKADNIEILTGILNIGEVSGVPIIERLLEIEEKLTGKTIIDCPPGTACTVMESISNADYCIIVAEPTLFGLHNFMMVRELVQLLGKPFGVVVNKSSDEESPLDTFCRKKQIPILASIPYDQKLAELMSNAQVAAYEEPEYRHLFENLLARVVREVEHEAVTHT